MNNPKQQRRITWRTAITLRTERGFLSRSGVQRAIMGLGTAARILDITIDGPLIGADSDAGMPLGHLLLQATEVQVIAHGPGVPALLEALDYSLRTAEESAAETARPPLRREAGRA